MKYSEKFLKAFDMLMEDEGGFVNDPNDPGGATKYGITKKTYELFIGREVEIIEMKHLTLDVAKEIYFKNYWIPLSCEYLENFSVAYCIFNTGVLHGLVAAAKTSQRVASIHSGTSIKIDGIIGNQTVKILNLIQPKIFLKLFHKQLLERIETLVFNNPKLEKFKNGWLNRTHRLLALADKPNKLV